MTFLDLSSFEKSDEQRKLEKIQQDCRSEAVQFAAGRMKSSGAIEKRLLEKQFSLDIIHSIMPGLIEDGYVHDLEIARAILIERRNRKAESHLALKNRMYKFGVPETIIEEVLENHVPESVLAKEFLNEHCSKLFTEYSETIDYNSKQKILAKLIRKAFSRGFSQYHVMQWVDFDEYTGE